MRNDEIVTGEALAASEGENVIDMMGMVALRVRAALDPAAEAALREVEDRALRFYERALAENERSPSVRSAVTLVRAYNAMADLLGMERV